MSAPSPQLLDALVDRWATTRLALITAVSTALVTDWEGVDPYDDAQVAAYGEAAAGTALAGQLRAGELMESYLRSVLSVLGVVLPAGRLAGGLGNLRRGVDPGQVYRRPAATFRWAESTDMGREEAGRRAVRRIETIADTDISMSSREASRRVLASADSVIGWRRVIRPEKAKKGSCGLCIAASDRVYSIDRLMPIHDGCNCVPMPVTRDNDPGRRLNGADLRQLYAAAGSTEAAKLRRVQFTVNDHGELGPVLGDERHAFRTTGAA